MHEDNKSEEPGGKLQPGFISGFLFKSRLFLFKAADVALKTDSCGI